MKKTRFLVAFLITAVLLYLLLISYIYNSFYSYSFWVEISNDNILVCRDYCEEREFEKQEWLLGKILDANDARKKAELVFIEVYGKEIKKQKPFRTYYDESNNVWLVVGQFPFPCRIMLCVGGTAHIVIDGATGKVLVVWHEK